MVVGGDLYAMNSNTVVDVKGQVTDDVQTNKNY